MESPQDAPTPSNSKERNTRARIFGWIGFAILAIWGASYFRDRLPADIQLRYVYRGVAHPNQLQRVVGELWTSKNRLQSRVTYFHETPLKDEGDRETRMQHLQLTRGTYRLHITLFYRDKPQRTLQRKLALTKEGTYHIYLKDTKPKR